MTTHAIKPFGAIAARAFAARASAYLRMPEVDAQVAETSILFEVAR